MVRLSRIRTRGQNISTFWLLIMSVPPVTYLVILYHVLTFLQPIGVGFSYGTRVNNSRDAALDVYDFFQKFYALFPHFLK